MTNGINNSGYNQYYKPYPYGATNNGTPGNFSGISGQEAVSGATEHAKDSAVTGMAMGMPTTLEGWKKFTPYVATAAVVSIGVTAFANALCRGKFDATILKKLGDKIDGSFLVNNKFVKAAGKKITDVISGVKGFFGGSKISNEIGEAIQKAPKPKTLLARGFLNGIKGQGIDEVMKGLKDLPDDLAKKFELTDVIKKLKKDGTDIYELFEKENLLEKLGKLADDPEACKIIEKLTVNKGKPGLLNLWRGFGLMKQTKNIDLNILINKVRLLEGEGAKTGIGKGVQKFIMGVTESVGGGVLGGGTFGIAMNALFLGQSLKQAGDAPKGERVKTFMEDFWGNMVGGFLLLPVLGRTFYKALGFKNISKHVTNGPVKVLLKPLELAGKLASVGLESKPATTILGKAGNKVKGFVGGAARFMIVMLGLSPIVTKNFMKGSHTVFGKPTKSQVDEMEGKNKQAQPTNNTVQPGVPEVIQQGQNPFNQQSTNTPMVDQFFNNRTPVVNNDQQSPALAAKSIKDADEKNPSRTYVPSADPVQLTLEANMNGLNSIINSSDKNAEYAENLLKTL